MIGQRELNKNSVNRGIVVELSNLFEELRLTNIFWIALKAALDIGLA